MKTLESFSKNYNYVIQGEMLMNKMKKILAVLCIAIAVVMCLPNLKFLSRAGFGDYFDSVKVEYGGSVTLIPDLSRLPSDFEIGQDRKSVV